MNVARIQSEVRRLPAGRRRKLTAWTVSEYPALSVEILVTRAAREVKKGTWIPTPPTAANTPKGKTLEHALKMAGRLGLAK